MYRALIRGPASVATGDARCVKRWGPPGAKKMRYTRYEVCANIYARKPSNKVRLNASRMPNLGKAFIRMPWDALEKKRAVVTLS